MRFVGQGIAGRAGRALLFVPTLALLMAGSASAANLTQIAYVPVGTGWQWSIDDMALDPRNNRLFTVECYADTLSVIDVSDPFSPSVQNVNLGASSCPAGLAMDAEGGRVFVALRGAGKVLAIDTATLARTEIFSVPGANKLAYDGGNGLYVDTFVPGQSRGLRKFACQGEPCSWQSQASQGMAYYNDVHRIIYSPADDGVLRLGYGYGDINVWVPNGSAFFWVRGSTYGGAKPYSGRLSGDSLYVAMWPSELRRVDVATLAVQESFPGTAQTLDCVINEDLQSLVYAVRGTTEKVGLVDLIEGVPIEGICSSSSNGRFVESSGRFVFASYDEGAVGVFLLGFGCP